MLKGKKLLVSTAVLLSSFISHSAFAYTMSCVTVHWQSHHFESSGSVSVAESYTYGGQYQRLQLYRYGNVVATGGPEYQPSPWTGAGWIWTLDWEISNNPQLAAEGLFEGALADWQAAVVMSTYATDTCFWG